MKVIMDGLPQLLGRCRDGDSQAIADLFHTYQEHVFRIALSVLDDGRTTDVTDEAEEVAQDALIAAIGALDSFHGEASFSTWLYSITLNTCRSRLRKRAARGRLTKVLQTIFFWEHAAPVLPEEGTMGSEQNEIVWQAIRDLDEKHRLPVILHYYQDFSVAEIAEMLDVNSGTVLSRLYTARMRLRTRLSSELEIVEVKKPGQDHPQSDQDRRLKG